MTGYTGMLSPSASSRYTRQAHIWSPLGIFASICFGLYCLLYFVYQLSPPPTTTNRIVHSTAYREYAKHRKIDLQSLQLNEKQCNATFPGLTKALDSALALGPFDLSPAGEIGPLQARIKDGKLYILNSERRQRLPQGIRDSRIAALSQIHQAIITSPSPLPDTIFSLNVMDQPIGTAWSYSLPAYPMPTAGNPPLSRAFLMPHFSFWAWRPKTIGSLPRAAAAITKIEATIPFQKKDSRAVWRGTTGYNSPHNPDQRLNLVKTAGKASWADVQALDTTKNGSNAMMIEDFCRHKYVIHTEGVTYSGRLLFHQMCRSVILSPPMAWLMHTSHLIRPLFSSDLDLGKGKGVESWNQTDGVNRAWPRHYRPRDANMVFVAPDWSDLGGAVRWLEDHPQVAEGIARRQRELFADRGYHSPAAESCYWRALIRAWSKVGRLDDGDWKSEGVRWEQLLLGLED